MFASLLKQCWQMIFIPIPKRLFLTPEQPKSVLQKWVSRSGLQFFFNFSFDFPQKLFGLKPRPLLTFLQIYFCIACTLCWILQFSVFQGISQSKRRKQKKYSRDNERWNERWAERRMPGKKGKCCRLDSLPVCVCVCAVLAMCLCVK